MCAFSIPPTANACGHHQCLAGMITHRAFSKTGDTRPAPGWEQASRVSPNTEATPSPLSDRYSWVTKALMAGTGPSSAFFWPAGGLHTPIGSLYFFKSDTALNKHAKAGCFFNFSHFPRKIPPCRCLPICDSSGGGIYLLIFKVSFFSFRHSRSFSFSVFLPLFANAL